MELSEIVVSARQALGLLAAFPFTWLQLVIAFLVVVESLMFIPYVGFIVKLCVAGPLAAQALVLFAAASSGEAPQLGSMLGVTSLSLSTLLVLIATGLIPFVAGLIYLVAQGGVESIAFFFGNILQVKPPAPKLFFAFKNVMYLAALPFTFVAAAVTLNGLSGWDAVVRGVVAATANGPALLVLLAISVLFEWLLGKLPQHLPKPMAATLAGILLTFFIAWSFAFLYALSVHALPHSTLAGGVPEVRQDWLSSVDQMRACNRAC